MLPQYSSTYVDGQACVFATLAVISLEAEFYETEFMKYAYVHLINHLLIHKSRQKIVHILYLTEGVPFAGMPRVCRPASESHGSRQTQVDTLKRERRLRTR